jgi:hypothetical protein
MLARLSLAETKPYRGFDSRSLPVRLHAFAEAGIIKTWEICSRSDILRQEISAGRCRGKTSTCRRRSTGGNRSRKSSDCLIF